jgi:hypothetical protein
MTRADNTRFLTQAAARRHQATLRKASDAIADLDSSGQPVNFSAVAAAAGVSRASLYRDPAIRDLINRMRSGPSRAATTRTAQRATNESLRARLDTARAENRPPANREHHTPRASRPPPRRTTRCDRHIHPASPPNTDPATPITPRQRHVHDAKTPHHQGLCKMDLR